MMKRSAIQLLLLLGSAMFLLPLVWMFSTAFKPADQTMTIPPTWLPRSYSVTREGTKVEVFRVAHLTVPSLLVQFEANSNPVPVSAASVRDGKWWDARGFPTPLTSTVREIPASASEPWEVVQAKDGSWLDAYPSRDVRAAIAPQWENFPKAIAAMEEFPRYLFNTVLLCVLNVLGTLISSSLAAYGFSRIDWRGRDKVFVLALVTMMIPFPVVMVPLYAMFRSLGWIGTLQPLWVGAFFANAFNVFLLRQFFRGLPNDLTDAARIDGCSEFRIFWQIVLPLCRPALVVVALFTFLGTWNDFLGPLVYLTDKKDFTLMLGLQSFQSQTETQWQYLMAASTLVTAPIILLFLFAQRSFIEGISLTGSKD